MEMKRVASAGVLIGLFAVTAHAGSLATIGHPARLEVTVPSAARQAGIAMLEVGIASAHRVAGGHPGAVVRLRRGGRVVELGRISIAAPDAHGTRSYQFNVTPALRRLDGSGAAEVEVELIDRGGDGPIASGAALEVGPARIVTR